MTEELEYPTSDLYFAGYLHASGITLLKLDRTDPHRVEFVFLDSPKIPELEENFTNGLGRISAFSYAASMRHLKYILMAKATTPGVYRSPKAQKPGQ